jgi:hypothetical protein
MARSDIAAVRLRDGRVLLAGGYDGANPVAVVEIFDPRSSTLSPAGTLASARAGAAAALLGDGTILLAGGGGPGGAPTASAELFDPATGRSTRVGDLNYARYKHAAVALADGRALVIGGSDARDSRGKLRSIESFDPATRSFREAGTMLEPRYKIAAAVQLLPGGKVLIAGGATRSELFDPATGRSAPVGPDFGQALNFATLSLLSDGSAFFAGGYGERGIAMSARAWRFRPLP